MWSNCQKSSFYILIIVSLFFSGIGLSLGKDSRVNVKSEKISFKGLILSTPALWVESDSSHIVSGLILGRKNNRGEKFTSLEVVNKKGKRIQNSPLFNHKHYQIAPGSQVTIATLPSAKGGTAIIVDIFGKLWRFPLSAPKQALSGPGDTRRSLLMFPPLVIPAMDKKGTRIFIIGEAFPMGSNSQTTVHLLDIEGKSIARFPQNLSARPASTAPIIEQSKDRAFLILENGQVTGFDLTTGKLLKGFPTPTLKDWPVSPPELLFHAPWNALVLSTGTNTLRLINPGNGFCKNLHIPGTHKFTGLASNGKQFFIMDEAERTILVMDSRQNVVGRISTDLPNSAQNLFLKALINENKTLLILASLPHGDHHAKVAEVFDKYADKKDLAVIRELADKTALRDYKTNDMALMTKNQRKEYKFDITAMKYSWLQNHIGWKKAADLVGFSPSTRIQTFLHSPKGTKKVLDETIVDYTPAAGFSFSPPLLPAFTKGPHGWVMALPLNYSRETGDPKKKMNSQLRLYQFKN